MTPTSNKLVESLFALRFLPIFLLISSTFLTPDSIAKSFQDSKDLNTNSLNLVFNDIEGLEIKDVVFVNIKHANQWHTEQIQVSHQTLRNNVIIRKVNNVNYENVKAIKVKWPRFGAFEIHTPLDQNLVIIHKPNEKTDLVSFSKYPANVETLQKPEWELISKTKRLSQTKNLKKSINKKNQLVAYQNKESNLIKLKQRTPVSNPFARAFKNAQDQAKQDEFVKINGLNSSVKVSKKEISLINTTEPGVIHLVVNNETIGPIKIAIIDKKTGDVKIELDSLKSSSVFKKKINIGSLALGNFEVEIEQHYKRKLFNF